MILLKQYFHGTNRKGPYFEGWYFKCQAQSGGSIALIPALHIDGVGQKSASIQVIADSGSWWLEFPGSDFHASTDRLRIGIGDNVFSDTGLSLQILRKGLSLQGRLDFGPLLPLKSDIMGPFRFLANMECSHGVISMMHPLQGQLLLNGVALDLSGGMGYVETDRGRSFPRAYLWTQCVWPSGSLMLSVATIPLAKIAFTGCICAIVYGGQEYRIATYLGAKVERWCENGAMIRQGKFRLEATLLDTYAQPLRAPANGAMGRTIHESLRSKMRYRFWIEDHLLFDRTDRGASFEYAVT